MTQSMFDNLMDCFMDALIDLTYQSITQCYDYRFTSKVITDVY